VNPIWLMGSDQVDKYIEDEGNKVVKIPILNDPENTKDILGYEYVNSKLDVRFCLYASNDSMVSARILTGDMLYIKVDTYASGDIVIVKIENKILMKRLHKTNDLFILKSDNLSNPDERVFTKKEMKSIEILGKVIMFRSETR
jgi:SOS-response transcriptional repressor LexA